MDTSRIKNIIKEEIASIFEDFNFDNSQKTFKPSIGMVTNCKKALQAIELNDLTSHGGNEGSGKEKAKVIISMQPMTHDMVKRMKAFFDNNESDYNSEISSGKNISNSGTIQSWNLWGGDAGKMFANSNIDRTKDRNLNRKGLRRDSGMIKTSTLMDPHNTRIKK